MSVFVCENVSVKYVNVIYEIGIPLVKNDFTQLQRHTTEEQWV